VAFTDFGSRNRWIDGRWQRGEPWVFTSYLSGGLDNLAELLHETGHAVHIACLRTRPAYLDWPDNDTFTEALADLAALDLYEPAWQQRFLGDSVPVATSLRAKYASIVFDFAWALFEIRVHATPDADPNAIWADITSRYLRIVPHPELSWWAMRGQLIDGPGYLINYALGAFIAADMRNEIARRWGPSFTGDKRRYEHLCQAIYRFGLEVPSKNVLESFLGRPVGSEALLSDLGRMTRR
jgi:oligoendopeptidase F